MVDGWGGEGAVHVVHGFIDWLCKVLVRTFVALCSGITQKRMSCVLFTILCEDSIPNC